MFTTCIRSYYTLRTTVVVGIDKINTYNMFSTFVNSSLIGRDRDIDLPVDETIVDVIAPFKDTKEPVEMTIGDGMEFTIPGTYT